MDKRAFSHLLIDALFEDEGITLKEIIRAFLQTDGPAAAHISHDADGNPRFCIVLAEGERAQEVHDTVMGETDKKTRLEPDRAHKEVEE